MNRWIENTPKPVLAAFLVILVVVASLALWIGATLRAGAPPAEKPNEATVYYCPMHPQIRLPQPGKCTICGMDLVPLEETTDPGPRALIVSDVAAHLADIATAPVERRAVTTTVRMVGKVEFDETRVQTISARVPGRLDRLYVDYTGIRVKESEHLVEIYSPELYSAQQELLETLKAVKRLQRSESELVLQSTRATVDAVREKLSLWGLTEKQIQDIERQDAPRDHILLTAPAGGVVIEKLANVGDYVDTGSPIYRIADLSRVWVMLDAYESDLAWLRHGQDVSFMTESYPGVTFRGRLDFVDWVVSATRTVKIRVNVDNHDGRLKPGMFVRAQVAAGIDASGAVIAPSMEGKWVCTMHPEDVADEPGVCSTCGMERVPASTVFGPKDPNRRPPLVIPHTAPLVTGKRAVVYVKRPDSEGNVFEGREIVLGPRANGDYVVLSGLIEGEEVVVRGNFKIDSALQIRAKPSMMNPQGGTSSGHPPGHGAAPVDAPAVEEPILPPEFQAALGRFFASYARIQASLASDLAVSESAARARHAETVLGEIDPSLLPDDSRATWQERRAVITDTLRALSGAPEIAGQRVAFAKLSRELLAALERFGHRAESPVIEMYCPMAFDNEGAMWLQDHAELENPYFGSSMLRCGETRRTRPAAGATGEEAR